MKKRLLAIVTLLMTAILLLCGCEAIQSNPAMEPKVNIFDSGVGAANEVFDTNVEQSRLPTIKIETIEEMDAFHQNAEEHFFTVESEDGRAELPRYSSFNDTIAAYTAEFFEEKTLVVCYAHTNMSPAIFEVSDISIEGKTLTVRVDTLIMGVNAGMEGRFIFIELSKKEMKGVTELVVTRDVGELM